MMTNFIFKDKMVDWYIRYSESVHTIRALVGRFLLSVIT